MSKPLVLIILDGWGHRTGKKNNAIAQAKTPFYDSLIKNYPHTLLNASQEHVGLPKGTIGNSEIGHMTMGVGKVIDTDLVRISKAMRKGEFYSNPAFVALFQHVKKYNSTLHVLGLLSRGGVHSHQEHLEGFLKAAKQTGIKKVLIHAFTDGRDVSPQSAGRQLKDLEKLTERLKIGRIVTLSGRYYAMDRDKNWDRTDKAFSAIFYGHGQIIRGKKSSEVMSDFYKQGILDEHLEPVVFSDNSGDTYRVENNDGLFFFNFRSDRPRQLSRKIVEQVKKRNLYFVTLTQYDPAIKSHVAFPPVKIDTTLAAEISRAGLTQSHIAETEKYGHVTFFFNGGRQEPHKNEQWFLIDTRKDVKTHDQAPQMRAREIADKAVERIQAGDDFVLINFANADIVGHTANRPAIIKAVEIIDAQLKKIVSAIQAKKGITIITADHGNAELNMDEKTSEKHTAHTTNLVPFILVSQNSKLKIPASKSGSLANLAPTILSLMHLKKPASMTGKSLIK